jgi:hypothetical protein
MRIQRIGRIGTATRWDFPALEDPVVPGAKPKCVSLIASAARGVQGVDGTSDFPGDPKPSHILFGICANKNLSSHSARESNPDNLATVCGEKALNQIIPDRPFNLRKTSRGLSELKLNRRVAWLRVSEDQVTIKWGGLDYGGYGREH